MKRLIVIILALAFITGCGYKIFAKVDESGAMTGETRTEPLAPGEDPSINLEHPDGTTTEIPIEPPALPTGDDLAGGLAAGAAVLPPPWNLLGLIPSLIPLIAGRKD